MMKALLFTALVLCGGFALASECNSKQPALSAQICFERFESNGAINAHAMDIRIGNEQRLSLNGGQAACVFLQPGNYVFTIEGCKAYEIDCKKWSSEKYNFSLRKGDSVRYEIYPTHNKHGYDGFFAAKVLILK
jgi:hypothetical protein